MAESEKIRYALQKTISEQGPTVFLQPDVLQNELTRHGIDSPDAAAISELVQINGFREFFYGDINERPSDSERYITNCIEQTAYQRAYILQLAELMAESMGKSLDAEFYNCDTKASSNQKRVLTSLPDDEKKIFIAAEREFVQAKKENRNMKKEDFNSLKNLAQRGYAKAAYYVGVCAMQHGNFQKATEYLCAADNAGDRGAAKLLGDCSYYQND